MDWDIINGITGIISALGALGGFGYLNFGKKSDSHPLLIGNANLQKLASLTVVCSGWVLCCLAFLWIMEPYGSHITDREYQQFFGVILSLPAIVVFLLGFKMLQSRSEKTSSKEEEY